MQLKVGDISPISHFSNKVSNFSLFLSSRIVDIVIDIASDLKNDVSKVNKKVPKISAYRYFIVIR